jgi:hypothetical protein
VHEDWQVKPVLSPQHTWPPLQPAWLVHAMLKEPEGHVAAHEAVIVPPPPKPPPPSPPPPVVVTQHTWPVVQLHMPPPASLPTAPPLLDVDPDDDPVAPEEDVPPLEP